jgi:hypothetical protein
MNVYRVVQSLACFVVAAWAASSVGFAQNPAVPTGCVPKPGVPQTLLEALHMEASSLHAGAWQQVSNQTCIYYPFAGSDGLGFVGTAPGTYKSFATWPSEPSGPSVSGAGLATKPPRIVGGPNPSGGLATPPIRPAAVSMVPASAGAFPLPGLGPASLSSDLRVQPPAATSAISSRPVQPASSAIPAVRSVAIQTPKLTAPASRR